MKSNPLSAQHKFWLSLAGLILLCALARPLLELPVVSFMLGLTIVLFLILVVIVLAALISGVVALVAAPKTAGKFIELRLQAVRSLIEDFRRGYTPASGSAPASTAAATNIP